MAWRIVRLGAIAAGLALIGLGLAQTGETQKFARVFVGLALIFMALVADLVVAAVSYVRTRHKRCPSCAEKVHPAAQVCRYCGHPFL
jgi:sulfite exporter TauE/SafE